jgi:hypothetical protein
MVLIVAGSVLQYHQSAARAAPVPARHLLPHPGGRFPAHSAHGHSGSTAVL